MYERVPHVTLKSIANNPDIKAGMTREEIDAAIARHAETEILYDRPYEDTGRSGSRGGSRWRACRRTRRSPRVRSGIRAGRRCHGRVGV